MIEIARAIEGVTINGKEWLLDEKGIPMQFGTTESAIDFLRLNGYESLSDDEFLDSFFFEETD